ncbi:hypothetical protein SELMODRAFT_161876 [Selaginella moellendorffii]|uniref:U1-type domain-containing protein n=1 Tax=Selaginella moellendorffii TaxID=88036 RepID=D8T814_SELML|nr:ribosome maturation protein SBDS [Selaginella moellendorffii]EFJ07134.1 hypothetical protein SELMODRAFT_161876 [Selaginella moellendorffii]|eukprot:XP_002991730.1 ribosome maturation protein SBDS [Selaginella moellendorffii]
MSRTLVQPVGQKRLTNVAVVRLKKHGRRFEIACYKNKVLSWRSRVEKDIDEVLQTHTVYCNVSKGILAKSKELVEAFGTADEEKICLEILEKGELQVAGKEREVQLSSQFRDIAGIVMDKTLNPETERPFTISMIERFMREVHFAVDPNRSSKKQALELIRELQSHFPITRALMRLKLSVSTKHREKLLEGLADFQAKMESRDEADEAFIVVCRVEPGHFRACDALIRECCGKLDVVSMAVHKDDDEEDEADEPATNQAERIQALTSSLKDSQLSEGTGSNNSRPPPAATSDPGKRCLTCDAVIGDPKEFREHYKSDWHKHNLKRKLKQLSPLSAEECSLDSSVVDYVNDKDDYSR